MHIMHVFMNVYIYVYMYVCVYAWKYICIYVYCIYACIDVWM